MTADISLTLVLDTVCNRTNGSLFQLYQKKVRFQNDHVVVILKSVTLALVEKDRHDFIASNLSLLWVAVKNK